MLRGLWYYKEEHILLTYTIIYSFYSFLFVSKYTTIMVNNPVFN